MPLHLAGEDTEAPGFSTDYDKTRISSFSHLALILASTSRVPRLRRQKSPVYPFRASRLRSCSIPGGAFLDATESLAAINSPGGGEGRGQEEGGSFSSRRWRASGPGRNQPGKLSH